MRAALPLLLLAGCRPGSPSTSVPVVDFIKEAHRAEQSPPAYSVAYATAGRTVLPALVGPSPGRLIWTLPLPRDAHFEARAAATGAPVRVRIGISDNRIYEHLGEATLTPGAPWTPISIGLSAYAGWKLSLFYRPDRMQWRFVLSADAVGGAAGIVAWGSPQIVVASTRNALEYEARRARLTRSGGP
jgi:hypothetical protein